MPMPLSIGTSRALYGGAHFVDDFLTLSGNEITDASRLLGTQGDGLLNDSSTGIWPAATNLCTNGGFETNTTGWTAGGTNTIASSATQFKFGAKSCLATYADNATLADYAITITNVAHTASCWLYIPTAYDGAGVELRQLNFTVAASAVAANMGLRDQWQRVTLTFTPGADVAGNLQINNTGAAPTAGQLIYIDGFQAETSVDTGSIATPYIETNGGTAARAMGRARVPISNLQSPQFWIALRMRMGFSSSQSGASINYPTLFFSRKAADSTRYVGLAFNAVWKVYRVDGGAVVTVNGVASWVRGDIMTLILQYTPTQMGISENGAAFILGANTNAPDLSAETLMDIGYDPANGRWGTGDYLWVAAGRGTLTNADAALIYAFGNTDPQIGAFPGQPMFMWDGKTSRFTRAG